jgi:serine/threonine protein kinase
VHRDLKPDNIVVIEDDDAGVRLKVLDFGIAKSLSSATAISTSPGQGTPLWTAPEQTRMDDVPKPTADVWALGLLTFFVFTGKVYWLHAHGASSMVQLSMELVRNPIAPPSQRIAELEIANNFPSGFDEWFLRCVNRESAQRYPDAGQALDGFMQLVERRGNSRYRLWLPVYSQALSGGVAITHDVSSTGMLLLSRSAPELGARIDLRFCLSGQVERTFEISASVIRLLPNDEDPDGLWRYQLAVEFTQPQPDMTPLLSEVAARLDQRAT